MSADRLKLLRDTRYFARELRSRIEALEDIERDGRTQTYWQQAAGLVGKIGRFSAEQAFTEHTRRERERRAALLREAFGR